MKETLSDSEGEEDKEDGEGAGSGNIDNTDTPKDGSDDAELSNLISDPTLPSEGALPTDPFSAEALETEGADGIESEEAESAAMDEDSSAVDNNSVPLGESAAAEEPPADEQMELGGVEAGPSLTEEDILTGPAHNLDDSQFKPDIVDPNLDDIFKWTCDIQLWF